VKQARFFCENCRKEVRWDAKVCPHCGRFFSSVRCPSCGFVGESRLFVWGCPNCGYAGGETLLSAADIPSGEEVETYSLETFGREPGRRKRGRHVPSWVYPLAIGVLLAVFALLVVVYLTIS